MMALEEGQDGDSVVEALLELGASVAFKNKVSVAMKRLLWHWDVYTFACIHRIIRETSHTSIVATIANETSHSYGMPTQ